MGFLDNKVARDFLEINAKPNCLAFKLSKELEEIVPLENRKIFESSIEMPYSDNKYFRYISIDNMSNFENIKKLEKKVEKK